MERKMKGLLLFGSTCSLHSALGNKRHKQHLPSNSRRHSPRPIAVEPRPTPATALRLAPLSHPRQKSRLWYLPAQLHRGWPAPARAKALHGWLGIKDQTFVIDLLSPLSTKTAKPGDTFTASVSQSSSIRWRNHPRGASTI